MLGDLRDGAPSNEGEVGCGGIGGKLAVRWLLFVATDYGLLTTDTSPMTQSPALVSFLLI
jgi:hypothetical protein